MPNLTVNNINLHYQCLGQGEDLLLIHGLGTNLAFWYPGIASLLSKHYRVIIYDLRGHGRSTIADSGYTVPDMTHDLHALLDHLGVTHVHLVGHSFGARIALRYAILHPKRIVSLTLADTRIQCLQPITRLRDWPYWEKTLKPKLKQEGRSLPSDEELINVHLLKQLNMSSPQSTQERLDEKAHKRSLRRRDMGAKGTAKWEQLIASTSAMQQFYENESIKEEDIKKLSMPCLAVYGEHSHCLPSCWKLQDLIRDCKVVIIPKAGHFYPVSQPRKFLDTLQQFLQANLLRPTLQQDMSK
jgi:pimeloyl-ACP methyl ester carboxylesterase